jgi:predicted lipoprotein with Yx(FWY)xxD motif
MLTTIRTLARLSVLPVVALAIAGCGSGGSSTGSTSSNGGGASKATVSVKHFSVGNVLVDASGRPLYSPTQEANGKILCTGSCTSIWVPLRASSAAPTGGTGVGKLGVVARADGTKQVTANGKPLYTFVEDSPGKLTGNGAADSFAGRHFNWQAVLASGKSAPPASSSGGGGGGGYGY